MTDRFFSIGEVLALLLEEFPDVSISKIRFLESQGLIAPERTPAGYRKFTAAEIERLRFILREQKDNFLPLRVIRDRLEEESSDGVLRPVDQTDPSMPRGIRTPSSGHPTARATARTTGTSTPMGTSPAAQPATRRHRIERFSRSELLETTGAPGELLDTLEKSRLVRPAKLGGESVYDQTDCDIVHLVNRLSALGVDPRHLITWRLAAEREADIFEPIVRNARLASKSNATSRPDVLLDELVGLGENLRTALVRSVTKSLREP